MSIETLSAFCVYALVTLLTPGPNNIMLLASGVNFGVARSLPHITGVAAGFGFMVLVVGLGLGAFFTSYPWLYTLMQYAGAAYLLYLAWKIANAGAVSMGGCEVGEGEPMSFLSAAVFQWVNPKAWMMAVSAISLYVPHERYFFHVVLISGLFSLLGLPSAAAWASGGTLCRQMLANEKYVRAFNIIMALLLAASVLPVVVTSVKHG